MSTASRRWIGMAGAAALCVTGSSGTWAQGVGVPFSPGWDSMASKPTYQVRVLHNVRVPMHDGVTLSADIYMPATPGRYPALIERTPYSNNSADEITDSVWYAQRGYVIVNEDVRGRFDSDGHFYPYRNEANDGYDTDAWVASQPWCNGKLGTLGGSYLGYTTLTQAIRHEPHLLSMATEVTSSDIYDGWAYVGGALHLGFALPWGADEINGHTNQNGTGVDDWSRIFPHLPIITADQAGGYVNQSYRDWLRHPLRSDPYWTGVSWEDQVQDVAAPLTVTEGWYDIFLRGALQDQLRIRHLDSNALAREHKRIIIGPWVHFKNHSPRIDDAAFGASQAPVLAGPNRQIDFGPAAQIDMREWYLMWHDHWLKGVDNGVDKLPPISIFVMGIDKWRYENEWPLKRTHWVRYYIGSDGGANTARGDGTLSVRESRAGATDKYDYDPANPVPTVGGNVCCSSVPNGPHNQAADEARQDVLVYTTPALEHPVEVTGPIKMVLYAATSAPDTDWTAKLVDVYPDGYAQNIQDGIIRARYRKGSVVPPTLLTPGQVYRYTIDLWATSNVFRPGHRIRVEISSSNFPRFDRNLNTGEDPATGTRMAVAHQTIYHSAKYASYILLPVIPPGSQSGRTN